MAKVKDFLFKYRMRIGNLAIGDASSGVSGIITALLRGSKTFDWPSIAAGASSSTTVTVTGAATGDTVFSPGMSIGTGSIMFYGFVSAANTVTVVAFNPTAGAVDLGSGTLYVNVMKVTVDA